MYLKAYAFADDGNPLVSVAFGNHDLTIDSLDRLLEIFGKEWDARSHNKLRRPALHETPTHWEPPKRRPVPRKTLRPKASPER